MDRHQLPTGADLDNMTGKDLRNLTAADFRAKAAALLLKAERSAESYRRDELVRAADVWARLATAPQER
ncbi:hypothetical protein LIX60_17495 [Streptomyces sp. S07_1.15]|uniref:hypothetical protein n=1 Tax=Streptomyces sp. S07_1.15 TaxID=2873925 RepID=UPI001D1430C1|nr:hypothetical protein [Streptomyces sp. S07_1.15]MCC3653224.1 hypothetical protein [Streptomyces sp. S07_1.15]